MDAQQVWASSNRRYLREAGPRSCSGEQDLINDITFKQEKKQDWRDLLSGPVREAKALKLE
jgi:hypothetical protein